MKNTDSISKKEVLLIRVASFLAFFIYPAFGFLFHFLLDKVIDDPLLERLLVASFALIIFVATFIEGLHKSIQGMVYTAIFIATGHVFWLAMRNDLNPYYQIGFLTVVAALNPYFKSIKGLSFYLSFQMILVLIGVIFNYQVDQIFFYSALSTVAAMSFLALDIRCRTNNKLTESRLKISDRNRDIKAILNNMHQGIMPIRMHNYKLEIDRDYSNFLTKLIQRDHLEGQDPFSIFFENTELNHEQLSLIREAISCCLNEELLQWDVNAHVLPDHTRLKVKDKFFDVELDWDPVLDKEAKYVEKILVTIRDITELKITQNLMHKKTQEIEMLSLILNVDALTFESFSKFATTCLQQIKEVFSSQSVSVEGANFKIALRELHTLKGLARAYSFDDLSARAHEVEDAIFATKTKIQNGAFIFASSILEHELSHLEKTLEQYIKINDELLKRNPKVTVSVATNRLKALSNEVSLILDQNRIIDYPSGQKILFQINSLYKSSFMSLIKDEIHSLERLAAKLNKETPEIHLIGENFLVQDHLVEPLKGAFIHLLRNALDHGIESAEKRLAANKEKRGTITIEFQESQLRGFSVIIYDDGRGLNLKQIRQKAIEKGLMAHSDLTDQEIAELIFHPEFSTASKLSEISGRGVGMDAVLEKLKSHGIETKLELRNMADNGNHAFAIHLSYSSQPLKFCA